MSTTETEIEECFLDRFTDCYLSLCSVSRQAEQSIRDEDEASNNVENALRAARNHTDGSPVRLDEKNQSVTYRQRLWIPAILRRRAVRKPLYEAMLAMQAMLPEALVQIESWASADERRRLSVVVVGATHAMASALDILRRLTITEEFKGEIEKGIVDQLFYAAADSIKSRPSLPADSNAPELEFLITCFRTINREGNNCQVRPENDVSPAVWDKVVAAFRKLGWIADSWGSKQDGKGGHPVLKLWRRL